LIRRNASATEFVLQNVVTAWGVGTDIISRGASARGLGTCCAGFFMLAAAQWLQLQQALALRGGMPASES